MIGTKCDSCRYWEYTDRDGVDPYAAGECRRRAPEPLRNPEPAGGSPARPVAVWPLTLPGQWCGEWETH